jgi:hypothetical protein
MNDEKIEAEEQFQNESTPTPTCVWFALAQAT